MWLYVFRLSFWSVVCLPKILKGSTGALSKVTPASKEHFQVRTLAGSNREDRADDPIWPHTPSPSIGRTTHRNSDRVKWLSSFIKIKPQAKLGWGDSRLAHNSVTEHPVFLGVKLLSGSFHLLTWREGTRQREDCAAHYCARTQTFRGARPHRDGALLRCHGDQNLCRGEGEREEGGMRGDKTELACNYPL